MDLHEALQWLDERGGSWSVRATSVTCIVIVAADGAKIIVHASHLSGEDVGNALLGAVRQLKEKCAA
jgi:hypothetical protein